MEETQKDRGRKVWEIFVAYFTSMLFAFTGGQAVMPLLQQQLVNRFQLTDDDKVLECFALGRALPGVLSLNTGILMGRSIAGWPGGLAAAAGVIVPAFSGMLFIAYAYNFISGVGFIAGAIEGIRGASIALIATNAISIIAKANCRFEWCLLMFALVTTLFLDWNMLLVILICGLAGVIKVIWRDGKDDSHCT